MTDYPNYGDYTDTRGRTPVDVSTITSDPRSLILVMDGQSMWANFAQCTTYTPQHPVYEYNPFDQKIYQSDGGPVLGCGGGTGDWAGRISITPYLADVIIGNGRASKVLLCNICVGGSSAEDWSPVGAYNQRKVALMEQLGALGITPNYCCSVQGQQDVAIGNTQDNYQNLRVWAFNQWRGLGMNGTIVVGLGVYWAGVSDANPTEAQAIRAGQWTAANCSTTPVNGTIVSSVAGGVDDDQWTGTQYRVDGVHWNDVGRYYTVQAWLQAFPVL